MTHIKCPNCGSIVEGEPGQEAVCDACGFRATVPASERATASPPTPLKASEEVPLVEPGPAGEVPAVKAIVVWGYIFSLAGLATFFLAAFVVPFVFALAGIALGFAAHLRDRTDRRGIAAVVMGILALVVGAIYLVYAA